MYKTFHTIELVEYKCGISFDASRQQNQDGTTRRLTGKPMTPIQSTINYKNNSQKFPQRISPLRSGDSDCLCEDSEIQRDANAAR